MRTIFGIIEGHRNHQARWPSGSGFGLVTAFQCSPAAGAVWFSDRSWPTADLRPPLDREARPTRHRKSVDEPEQTKRTGAADFLPSPHSTAPIRFGRRGSGSLCDYGFPGYAKRTPQVGSWSFLGRTANAHPADSVQVLSPQLPSDDMPARSSVSSFSLNHLYYGFGEPACLGPFVSVFASFFSESLVRTSLMLTASVGSMTLIMGRPLSTNSARYILSSRSATKRRVSPLFNDTTLLRRVYAG
ncbi:hypothetical protein Thimo_0910 [Thioflavicoccus mobilis 8321]|uniref:Uncharacterized protein n=1 Tax=Thioflavicoccus mobilis 8321 TaxID=765912 RepID=L0GUQ8_9GAMM|nr:hypothetical protein Thimo_0910 [Thioflavicoccus mobilis 8321]